MNKIFLVEDERIFAENHSRVLEKHAYSVLCAFSGEDAARIVRSENDLSFDAY